MPEAQPFDLLLHGGQVFDPQDGSFTEADLGLRDGLVARLGPVLDGAKAHVTADVTGCIVTPGLVDLHLHAYPGATYWGMEVDWPCLSQGVTTAVDAGSAGAYTFAGLERRLRDSRLQAHAFLNIAGGGLAQPFGELLAPEAADVEVAVRVARRHPERIRGLKLRASPNTVGAHGAEALAALRRAADETGLPVMVHVSEAPPDLAMVLAHLRAGDLLTHCFTPYDNGVMDGHGRLRQEARRALDRGVLLDVGHGSGSFSFPAAEAYLAADLPTPVTSTDLHARSVLGPAFDMTTVMSKMLAAGMPPAELLRSVTSLPAAVLGKEARLREGAVADVAVLALEQGPVWLWDSRGVERTGERRWRARLTVRAGEPVFVDSGMRLRSGGRS